MEAAATGVEVRCKHKLEAIRTASQGATVDREFFTACSAVKSLKQAMIPRLMMVALGQPSSPSRCW